MKYDEEVTIEDRVRRLEGMVTRDSILSGVREQEGSWSVTPVNERLATYEAYRWQDAFYDEKERADELSRMLRGEWHVGYRRNVHRHECLTVCCTASGS